METSVRGLALQDGSSRVMSHGTPTGESQSVKSRESYTCGEHICHASSMGRCPEIPGMLELWLIPSSEYAMLFPMKLCQWYEFNLYVAFSKRSTTKTNNRLTAKSYQQKSREPCHSLKMCWRVSELPAFPLGRRSHYTQDKDYWSISPGPPWDALRVALGAETVAKWLLVRDKLQRGGAGQEALNTRAGLGRARSLRFHHDTWNGIQFKT